MKSVHYLHDTSSIPCRNTGGWDPSCDAVFKSNIMLRDGVDIPCCIVSPDRDGLFCLGIVNYTTQNLELRQDVVLGKLTEVLHLGQRGSYALNASEQPACYSTWQISSHQWSDPLKEEMSRMHVIKMSNALFLKERGKWTAVREQNTG